MVEIVDTHESSAERRDETVGVQKLKSTGESLGVQVLGPVAAPMERRAGRFRGQLLLQAGERGPLHGLLTPWLEALEGLKSGRRVRWSLDVDPQEML